MPDHAHSDDPDVQRQLDRLNALSPGRDIFGLERITALLERMDNPHHRLPPVLHVAGTNGKGSTCAFLRAAIEASGQSCHVYSSPHLVRFNERIRLAGSLIDDALLAHCLERTLDAAEDLSPSFFEATTAAAFLAFSEHPASACIIEVGLGGRLDATNVVPSPVACGIASLGIDHEAFLLAPDTNVPADPMERIAYEKAGIAKSGSPLVIQRYASGMNGAIAGQAMQAGAPVIARGEDWDVAIYDGRLHYRDASGKLTLPVPRLPGAHQADNAGLAIAMLRHQQALDIPDAALAAAMGWADWPARLQLLGNGPLTALLPPGTQLWLDGGHNADAGRALAAHFGGEGPRLHLVIGMLANKDPAALITPLLPRLASISAVPVPGHEWHTAEQFAALAPQVMTTAFPDVASALKALKPGDADMVLIAGSLYLAGNVLAANGQAPE
ncbi:MAG: folylpolyglutamate synthase/dihydrofolate synthase family protein [Blastomonas sp.]